MARRSRNTASGVDTWAGFVDALSTLLVVLIFALVVFMLAQFFQGIALSGRDAALAQLEHRVAELADMLSLERSSNADLRLEMTQLSSELQRATSGRDEAAQALALLSAERDGLIARLSATENYAADAGKALDDAQSRIELLQSHLERAMEDIAISKDSLSLKLAEVASLQRDIDALQDTRDNLEAHVARMVLLLEEAQGLQARTAEELTQSEQELAADRERIEVLLLDLTAERDHSMELETSLSDEAERTALAQSEIEERDIRLTELAQLVTMTQEERDAAESMSDRRLNQLDLLSQQLDALRSQIAALNEVLEASEAQSEADQVQITELGARLNAALAAKVQELSRYRSEFFEKLVQVLSERTDIIIVGDRFVLPSELLFESGSADISPEGRPELDKIAALIIELSGEIPDDVEWVLRVDGHTDNVPIATNQFPSNWELSTARATSVVRYLVSRGVAPDHLAAAGFGEFQPIADANNEDGRRQNRRIEFKLTEK
jgi:chemotaxis protein MotB